MPHDILTLDAEDEVNYTFAKTLQNQLLCTDFMRDFEQTLYQTMLQRFNQQHPDFQPEQAIFPIKTYRADEIDAERFKEIICQPSVEPIIIKDFIQNSDAVKNWSFDFFRHQCADAEVSYYIKYPDGRIEDALFAPLSTVIDRIENATDEIVYIHNTSQIFKDHRELLHDIHYDRLKTYYKPIAVNAIVQLFMGGKNTGVQLHCANEFNSFLMVHGKKRWTFIAPEYSYALFPEINSNALNAVTAINDHTQSFAYFEQHAPLYNRIPKLVGDIEPGDMLVFSPWWWHAVENTTPTSIATATRWTALKHDKFPRGNIIFENIQKSNPLFKEYSKLFVDSVVKGELIGDKSLQRETFGKYHQPRKDD